MDTSAVEGLETTSGKIKTLATVIFGYIKGGARHPVDDRTPIGDIPPPRLRGCMDPFGGLVKETT